jgi:hypothetical protein
MPRPYNWIRGEGTTKNQRWGLGSFMDVPNLPQPYSVRGFGEIATTGAPCPGTPGCPGYDPSQAGSYPDVEQQIADVWDYLFKNAPVDCGDSGYETPTTVTVMPAQTWIRSNWPLLAIGGLGVFLLARR